MSDYSRIKSRLKKSGIEFKEVKQKKEWKHSGNSTIEFGAVKMYISPKNKIVGIYIFDMRVDIENCVEKWSNDSNASATFADFLLL